MKKLDNKKQAPSRYAYNSLDRVIHEPARLSILTSLVTQSKGRTFGELKRLCALTDGNLNRHLQVLEDEKLLLSSKSTEHNRPQTSCRITALGRKRYLNYLAVLEQVLTDAAAVRVLGSGDALRGVQG